MSATCELSSILTKANHAMYQISDPGQPAGSLSLGDSKDSLQLLTSAQLPAELLGPCKWYNTDPQFWSKQNVLEWISYHVEETKFDASTLNMAYCTLEGSVLCQMSRDTMLSMFGPLGDRLYHSLQDLKAKNSVDDITNDILNTLFTDLPEIFAEDTYNLLPTVVVAPGPGCGTDFSKPTSRDVQSELKMMGELPSWNDLGYESGPTSPDSLDSSSAGMQNFPSSPDSGGSDSELDFSEMRLPSATDSYQEPGRAELKPGKRGRGRPRKLSRGAEDCMDTKKSKHAPRGTHLWEFIRDILIHPELNNGLMKWEDRREGVFKFLKSEAVAQLWGQKKKNSSMTYEKLSRAMRYYYKREILERVDGRRLVYKFGKNSSGWKVGEMGLGM
ncbi:ETS-related transcription factor Elf-3 [Lepisosteus oculatus]|uniref:ETS-related transcription factor Elf-3 n=1 Tax=Lepisosteus oculatus TaxID=7918 RepID=UPI00371D6307